MDMSLRETLDMTAKDDWVSAKEAAAMLPGTSLRSVQNWCKRRQLEGAVRLPSGRWQIPVASIDALMESPQSHDEVGA